MLHILELEKIPFYLPRLLLFHLLILGMKAVSVHNVHSAVDVVNGRVALKQVI